MLFYMLYIYIYVCEFWPATPSMNIAPWETQTKDLSPTHSNEGGRWSSSTPAADPNAEASL